MLFYDFEVFKFDWLVVFYDSDQRKKIVIVNDREEFENFYNEHKSDIWVGFNSKNYDQFIAKAILCGFDPKEVNDYLISGGKGWQYSQQFRKFPIINYDVMFRIDRGLKVLEGFMGSMIKESSVDFNVDRKLTDEEIQETIRYCTHDVEQTIEIFIEKYDTFEATLGLLKMFDLPLSDIGKTEAMLSAKILKAVKKTYTDEFEVFFPSCLRVEKYTEVLDFFSDCYANAVKKGGDIKKNFYTSGLSIDIAGVPHDFRWGGIHGARKQYHGKGIFINMDVASMYPSIMLVFDLLSRSCSKDEYRTIYENRLKYKGEGNPLQKPLKIVLNAVYGAMRQETSAMYDPRNGALVCVFGQVLLLDLIEKLEPVCDIIQSNTDGILVKLRNEDDYELIDDIVYEWEQRTGLSMEFDEFCEVYQKDVNNYVIIRNDGSYKSKGAYTMKQGRLDYELPIVNKALVDYMVKGIPVEKTINDCDKLQDFQMIVKSSSKYAGLWYGEKKLQERCVRAFASKNKRDKGLFKRKSEHATSEKIANTPEHCFMVNENVENSVFDERVDKGWYIELAKKRLEDFGL